MPPPMPPINPGPLVVNVEPTLVIVVLYELLSLNAVPLLNIPISNTTLAVVGIAAILVPAGCVTVNTLVGTVKLPVYTAIPLVILMSASLPGKY